MKKQIVFSLLLTLVAGFAAAGPTNPVTSPNNPPACAVDKLGTSRTLPVGTKGGPEVGLESYPRTLPLADHEVILTFDDGPAATTSNVLDALSHECVKATFFLVGRNAEARPWLVKRELAEGHTLGHHTWSHPARTLRRMGLAAAEGEIEKGFKADDTAAYGAADDKPRVKFFRFPGFADTKALDVWLAGRDVAVFGTDLWAYDWLDESPEQELRILMARLDRTKKGIILLHDTRSSTARMVPALLQALKAGGYKVVHIVPGPGIADTVPAPEGWTSDTDRIIAQVFGRGAGHRRRRANVAGLPRRRRDTFAMRDVGGTRFIPLTAMRMARRERYAFHHAWRFRSAF